MTRNRHAEGRLELWKLHALSVKNSSPGDNGGRKSSRTILSQAATSSWLTRGFTISVKFLDFSSLGPHADRRKLEAI